MVGEIMAGIGVALTLYQIADSKITKYLQIQRYYAERLGALRREVQANRETVTQLMKRDNSVQAVYDPVVRRYINALRYGELKKTCEAFDPIVGKLLKKAAKKAPNKKDPMRIFWNIKDTCRKLESLQQRMKTIPAKPARNAPRIILVRRLPALEWRLREIDEALKIIQVKK